MKVEKALPLGLSGIVRFHLSPLTRWCHYLSIYQLFNFLDDGEKVLLKTSNLKPIEIAEEVKVLDEIHQKRLDEFNAAKRKKR